MPDLIRHPFLGNRIVGFAGMTIEKYYETLERPLPLRFYH
jgi:hypothetical protein